MASYFLAPIANDAPFFLSTGVPASGAKLFTYIAGSTTKQNTYQDNAGNTLNANPILLNSSGYPASGGSVVEIWGNSGVTYKFVLAPSTDSDPPNSPYWTRDNVALINDVSATASEWTSGPTPTFISATSFSLVGDQTPTFQVGMRVKTTNTAGTIYSTIVTSAFTTLTTVTVVNDSGTLDSGLSAVSYGLLSATHPSIPSTAMEQPTVTVASASTVNLTTAGSRSVIISGVVTITAITLGTGQFAYVEFSGILTLTNGASLVLPGGANITTAAGDTAFFRGESGGVVRCIVYQKASGNPLLFNASTGSFTFGLTGMNAATTGTAKYSVTNNAVSLFLPNLTGTSTSTVMTGTGLPAAIQPTSSHGGLLFGGLTDNGGQTTTPGRADIATGTITFYASASSASGFTGTGVKGLGSPVTLSYTLD